MDFPETPTETAAAETAPVVDDAVVMPTSENEGLRQRKTPAAAADGAKPAGRRGSIVDQAMEAALQTDAGKKVHAVLLKGLPYLTAAAAKAKQAYPYVKTGYQKCLEFKAAVEPYNLWQYWSIICGLVLIFFGGHFVTTIATVEAIRLCGWQRSKDALTVIYDQLLVAKAASDKDDKEDKDNDGVADTSQITESELVTRKMLLVFRTVDPEQLSSALGCIYSGWIAVMATLRLKFARAITLGCNIGGYISQPLKKKFIPVIQQGLPQEYHKWIPVVIDYICKSFGITLAWFLVRVINAFNAACRGAHMLVRGIDEVSKKNGMDWLADGQLDDMIAWSLAAFGFYSQLTSFFYLPWYLQLPLLPFTILESVLTNMVGTYSE